MINTGVVGLGHIGIKRIQSFPKELDLVGIYDIDTSKALKITQHYPTTIFPNVDSLCEHIGAGGLLIVATNHLSLAPVARIALKRGIHVLVEKPGAISSTTFEELLSTAISKNVVLRVGYNHRFHPGILAAYKEVMSKKYGDIQFIRARYGHGGRLGYENEWRANREISGGGELIDQGSHLLDLTQFLAGDTTLIFSDTPTIYWNMNVEDNAILYGEFKNNGKFLLHASWTEWKNLFSLEIFLKTAKIEVFGLGGSYGNETIIIHHMENGLGIPTMKSETFMNLDNSWKLELDDVVSAITGKPSIGADGACALEILKKISIAYSS